LYGSHFRKMAEQTTEKLTDSEAGADRVGTGPRDNNDWSLLEK
jgi:hypothetical protein